MFFRGKKAFFYPDAYAKKDRHRYLQWLYQAKKRYKLTILHYMVTSNDLHLLVFDTGNRDVIFKSMQLVAGRIGQEYNQK